MPRIMSTKEVKAYAHCPNPYCEGHVQEQVPAIEQEVGRTFAELGGGGGGLSNHIERSWVDVDFADRDESKHSESQACKHCDLPRTLSARPRAHIPNISGVAQDGLITIKGSPMASGFQPRS